MNINTLLAKLVFPLLVMAVVSACQPDDATISLAAS